MTCFRMTSPTTDFPSTNIRSIEFPSRLPCPLLHSIAASTPISTLPTHILTAPTSHRYHPDRHERSNTAARGSSSISASSLAHLQVVSFGTNSVLSLCLVPLGVKKGVCGVQVEWLEGVAEHRTSGLRHECQVFICGDLDCRCDRVFFCLVK